MTFKLPKRGRYRQNPVTCDACNGSGKSSGARYPGTYPEAPRLVPCPQCVGTGGKPPRATHHQPDCTGCGGVYRCAGCRRWVGWCNGASDDMPEHCDECWCKAHPAPIRRALRGTSATGGGDRG